MSVKEVPRNEGSVNWELVERDIRETTRVNALDRALLSALPRWGQGRLRARQEAGYRIAQLAVGRAYNTVFGTTERPQTHLPLTTEDALLPGWDRYQILQEARQLYRNDPIIRALVDGVARRVGSPRPHFHTSNEDWNRETLEQWTQWCMEQCDFTGNMTDEEMDEQIVRSCYTDGDIGEIFIDVDGDLQLQLIESDRIAPDQRVNINLDTHNPMAGVWVDWKNGRVRGYQVGKRGMNGLLVDSEFKSASDMALYFRNQRTEQRRGVPILHPVINPAKDLARYLNAVRISMNAAASFGVFIERNNAAQFQLAETKVDLSKPNYRTLTLPNGKVVYLNPGEQYKQMEPKMPGPDFDPVSRFMVRNIARGAGSIYELVMADFSGMSYSSSKSILMFIWAMQEDWQDWLIRRRKRRQYNVWVAKRMETGRLPFNAEAFTQMSWIKAARSGFDPLEDAEAIVKLLGSGAMTYRRFFAAQGLNEEVELTQAAKEASLIYKLAKQEGIPPEAIASTLAPGVMTSGNGPQSDPVGPGTQRRGGAQD